MRQHKTIVKTPKDEVVDIHENHGKVVFNWYYKEGELYLQLDPNIALDIADALIAQANGILDKEDDSLS